MFHGPKCAEASLTYCSWSCVPWWQWFIWTILCWHWNSCDEYSM